MIEKYKLVKNFLDQSEINMLHHYTRLKHRYNNSRFDTEQTKMGETAFYSDLVMESLLINKLKLMEEKTNLKLYPTYSFWRMYAYLSDLKKHKDRPSCEISVSVMIGSCGTDWKFYVGKENFNLKPGDAVIYKGCEVEHWRDEFQGDWHSQVFLHYVDANGKYKEFHRDQRQLLGMQKIL